MKLYAADAAKDKTMSELGIGNIIYELNERAVQYHKGGLSIEVAIKQAVTDWAPQLKGVGYKILSEEEIKRNNYLKFFEAYP